MVIFQCLAMWFFIMCCHCGVMVHGMYGGNGLWPLFQHTRVPEALREPMQWMHSFAMMISATRAALRSALMMIVTASFASTCQGSCSLRDDNVLVSAFVKDPWRLEGCFWKARWVREFVKNDLVG